MIELARLALSDHFVLNIATQAIVSRAHESPLKCGRRARFDVER